MYSSDAKVDWKAPINSQVSLFDCATPGTLPSLNRHCVVLALRAARATGCTVARRLLFDRKHYEHWDLPAGYQITQKREPIGINGLIEISPNRIIGIKQIHLEQVSLIKGQYISYIIIICFVITGLGKIILRINWVDGRFEQGRRRINRTCLRTRTVIPS